MNPEIRKIYNVVNKVFALKLDADTKKYPHAEARSMFYYYCKKKFPTLSDAEVAKQISKDRITVYYALKKLNSTYLNNPILKNHFEKIGDTLDPNTVNIELKKRLVFLEKEIDRLKQRNKNMFDSDLKQLISEIPEHKIEDFKETRLKPYLKMNSL